MAYKAPANPAAREPKVKRHFEFSRIFKSGRMIGWFIIFTLLFCLSAAMLGLTSQQIHRHGGQNTFDYPGKEYGHTIGLLLFTSIFCLLIALFHWALSVRFYIVLFFIMAIFNGVGAGILERTPFGQNLHCQNPTSSFPESYQPYINDCSRVMAISALSWSIFALSVIGFLFAIFDHFSFSVKNTKAYDIEKEPTIIEKHLDRAESGATGTNQSHHTSA